MDTQQIAKVFLFGGGHRLLEALYKIYPNNQTSASKLLNKMVKPIKVFQNPTDKPTVRLNLTADAFIIKSRR